MYTEGTEGWANWRDMLAGRPRREGWEFTLYSDAYIAGELTDLGPYELHNAAVGDLMAAVHPVLVLRLFDHGADPLEGAAAGDFEAYHAGGVDDEIAALLSLATGVRLRSGGAVRWFRDGQDPLGTPCGFGSAPAFAEPGQWPIVPRARQWSGRTGALDLEVARSRIELFPRLSSGSAALLVRAARQYQEGLLVCESDVNLAWLRFVGALETAALSESLDDSTPVTRLKDSVPTLYEMINASRDVDIEQVAQILDGRFGATSRFVSFVMIHAPEPPTQRPALEMQVDWEKLRRAIGRVYDYRSKALHAGTPFPDPMLRPPRVGPGSLVPDETVATGEGVGRFVWDKADVPMRLHVFEHITREVLLHWWSGLWTEY